MHYHLEVILPEGTKDIENAIQSVMRQFDENASDEDDSVDRRHAFWDFYVIGGRYAGTKQLAKYNEAKLKSFYDWLTAENVTVASFQAGKQEIAPASQIPKVDAKWNEMFPSSDGKLVACPIFRHSNDQYGHGGRGTIDGDISLLGDSLAVKCHRVMFAGPSFVYDQARNSGDRTGPLEAVFMLSDTFWNGVNHVDVVWDGTIGDALAKFKERLSGCAEGYRSKMMPSDNWIAVTVDYHS